MGNEKSVRADFSKNTATQRGGCIYGDLTIEGGDSSNITFSENTAEQGGCIYSPDSTTLEAGTFSGNTAQQGGCIYSEKYQSWRISKERPRTVGICQNRR